MCITAPCTAMPSRPWTGIGYRRRCTSLLCCSLSLSFPLSLVNAFLSSPTSSPLSRNATLSRVSSRFVLPSSFNYRTKPAEPSNFTADFYPGPARSVIDRLRSNLIERTAARSNDARIFRAESTREERALAREETLVNQRCERRQRAECSRP